MTSATSPVTMQPVAFVRSPWPEKFGIPRQSGLAQLESTLELADHIPDETLRGLEGVSHLWVIACFHAARDQGWRPTVRPPRLGGSVRLGVFATRSPHRPNPIALSLVELCAIEPRRLRVRGADLLDGTPVLDIKPYLPWAEALPEARCSWAPARPEPLQVEFSEPAAQVLNTHPHGVELRTAIEQSLRWDPRPAHQRSDHERRYGAAVAGLNVRFGVDAAGLLTVEAITENR